MEIFQKLKTEGKVERFKYKSLGPTYACANYEILENPDNLTGQEMVAIVDKGNYNFGYRIEGRKIIVYTD